MIGRFLTAFHGYCRHCRTLTEHDPVTHVCAECGR